MREIFANTDNSTTIFGNYEVDVAAVWDGQLDVAGSYPPVPTFAAMICNTYLVGVSFSERLGSLRSYQSHIDPTVLIDF